MKNIKRKESIKEILSEIERVNEEEPVAYCCEAGDVIKAEILKKMLESFVGSE